MPKAPSIFQEKDVGNSRLLVIELVNNPAHKRSKLLRLTPKGEAVFAELSDRIAVLSETLAEQEDAA